MSRRVVPIVAVAGLLILAAIVRFDRVLASPLPLGDGGLFLRMVETVRASAPGLPELIEFSGEQIPFVYPPLPFLVAGWLSGLGVSALDVVHYLPAIVALATVPLFFLLARRVIPGGLAPYAALAAFALMPTAFEWLVAGGGLSRSFGMLFALGALALAADRTAGYRAAVGAGVLLGLTALSHPQVAIFATLGVVILAPPADWLPRIRRVAMVGLVAALVVLPWLVMLVARGQIGDLLAGGQRWMPVREVLLFLSLDFSGAQVFDVFLALGVAGLAVEVLRGRWRIPAWILATYLASGGLFMVAVPWALAAGAAVQQVADVSGTWSGVRRRLVPLATGGTLLVIALIAAQVSALEDGSKRHGMSPGQGDAMEWVRTESDPATRFAIVSTETWANDLFSEWFPALADRTSVVTPQGTEWLGEATFDGRVERHQSLETCARRTSSCLAELIDADATDGATTFVIPKDRLAGALSADDCCPALRETVRDDARFRVIYDGPGATIAEWVEPSR